LALKNNLLQPGNFNISIDENKIKALPLSKTNEIEFLQKKLKCMFSGILLAEQKGKDFIPSINLALSKQLDITKFVTVEVDLKTALLFLQKEAIVLPETDKAYVLLLYQKLPIGWVKNLGSRCNNMYPQEWRIRMKLTV
jgi:NOL1/NOP2/fmu family ribosome biogenesis protein